MNREFAQGGGRMHADKFFFFLKALSELISLQNETSTLLEIFAFVNWYHYLSIEAIARKVVSLTRRRNWKQREKAGMQRNLIFVRQII